MKKHFYIKLTLTFVLSIIFLGLSFYLAYKFPDKYLEKRYHIIPVLIGSLFFTIFVANTVVLFLKWLMKKPFFISFKEKLNLKLKHFL